MRKNELIKSRLYFALSVLLLTAVSIVVYTSARKIGNEHTHPSDPVKKQIIVSEDEAANLQQVSSTPSPEVSMQSPSSAVTDDGTAQTGAPEKTYCLTVEDGCLQVLEATTGELYMETAIAYDLLPVQVQQEINEGKYFESENALLEFLENYSS